MSLPSSARRDGVSMKEEMSGNLDLGKAIVTVPGGSKTLRRNLLDAVTAATGTSPARGSATTS